MGSASTKNVHKTNLVSKFDQKTFPSSLGWPRSFGGSPNPPNWPKKTAGHSGNKTQCHRCKRLDIITTGQLPTSCSTQPSIVHWLSSSIFPCWLSRYRDIFSISTPTCPTPSNIYIFWKHMIALSLSPSNSPKLYQRKFRPKKIVTKKNYTIKQRYRKLKQKVDAQYAKGLINVKICWEKIWHNLLETDIVDYLLRILFCGPDISTVVR